jgi:microcystin-dependent protein
VADPFLGEIRIFAGNFAPRAWALCAGQLLPISQNDALFALLGTTYGGDGQTTFALPDLRGRVPIHFGTSAGFTVIQGQVAGTESVTLTRLQNGPHTHPLVASLDVPAVAAPTNNLPGQAAARIYRAGNPSVTLNSAMVQPAGGAQPHENRQPFLALNFIIALEGIFPSRN